MPADRRLRELQNRAQLGDGQLAAIEQQQQAAARRVRQRRQSVENSRRAAVHQSSIRMEGYNTPRSSSTSHAAGVRLSLVR